MPRRVAGAEALRGRQRFAVKRDAHDRAILIAALHTSWVLDSVSMVTLAPLQLNVVKTGTGSGTVTSTPAGINCGATCSAPYAYNTVVKLTAAASAGSTFTGWSGACGGLGDCYVTEHD